MSESAKHDSGSFSQADDLLAEAHAFVEEWLSRALPAREAPPRRLHGALHEAVFGSGRRTHPLLCRLLADLYGVGDRELVGRFAAALELVHCASRAQDDRQSHGQATAILVGDALLTLAFETLANATLPDAALAFRLMRLLGAAAGGSQGVIAAQAIAHEGGASDLEPLLHAAAIGAAIIAGVDPAEIVVALQARGATTPAAEAIQRLLAAKSP